MYASNYGSWMHGSGMFGGGPFMILMWLFLIALVVGVVVLITKRSGLGSAENTALDILKERYVRGEIERGEFEQKKHDLEG